MVPCKGSRTVIPPRLGLRCAVVKRTLGGRPRSRQGTTAHYAWGQRGYRVDKRRALDALFIVILEETCQEHFVDIPIGMIGVNYVSARTTRFEERLRDGLIHQIGSPTEMVVQAIKPANSFWVMTEADELDTYGASSRSAVGLVTLPARLIPVDETGEVAVEVFLAIFLPQAVSQDHLLQEIILFLILLRLESKRLVSFRKYQFHAVVVIPQ
ncbi:uncharacterized protein BCR38DRAFT_405057 [Pseudomassariella vexata]|uniref:Uncharacterized protein n=1 Tax=Pseudomassariella vexata TaxID=1141098 RepID=A0A1Y2EKI9_9PEZI|nr:uncharacterized protein BCR38DRAFT_405057 [Pseudomassariella vexata]ORY72049.1 hypothetical protein BCR38DRAFT_405057 [Pseudomassariella vexata]